MTDDVELLALKRSFPRVLLGVVIAFVLIGGVIAAFGSSADRPEGAAEHFLNDLSDTARKGVQADARKRAAKLGSLDILDLIDPAHTDTDGKALFTEIEVGAATVDPLGRWVPFRVQIRDAKDVTTGALLVAKVGDDWRITGLGPAARAKPVPSEGGPKVASATPGVYAGAIVVGFLITVAVSFLVRRLGASATHE